MKVGDVVKVVDAASTSLGNLSGRSVLLVRKGPGFWLAELGGPKEDHLRSLGGWFGVAINGCYLRATK